MVADNNTDPPPLWERAISSLAAVYHGGPSSSNTESDGIREVALSEHTEETVPLKDHYKSYQTAKPENGGQGGRLDPLMMPSANSTNLSSAMMARGANWQTLHRAAGLRYHNDPPRHAVSEGNLLMLPPSMEYSDGSMAVRRGYKGSDIWGSFMPHQKKRKFPLWVVPLLLVVVVAACLSLLSYSRQTDRSVGDGMGGISQYIHGDYSPPFSKRDPTSLPFPAFYRGWGSSPGKLLGRFGHGVLEDGEGGEDVGRTAIPTNSWYESLLILDDGAEPQATNRAYVIPYVVDTVGPTPGLRMYPTSANSGDRVIQMIMIENHGLTVGAKSKAWDHGLTFRYEIYGDEGKLALSPLACTMKWDLTKQPTVSPLPDGSFESMTSSIVRGMPYSTMHYHLPEGSHLPTGDLSVLPTVSGQINLFTPPVVDAKSEMKCVPYGEEDASEAVYVDREVSLEFIESDFRWLVFYSRPVYVKCVLKSPEAVVQLQVVSFPDVPSVHKGAEEPFTIRVGLANTCARGESALYCDRDVREPKPSFDHLLRKHADIYPGYYSTIAYDFISETNGVNSDESLYDSKVAHLIYNWDAKNMREPMTRRKKKSGRAIDDPGMLLFAMSHQFEGFVLGGEASITKPWPNCVPSLLGPACLVQGNTWRVQEDLRYEPSDRAPRPPRKTDLKDIADALKDDIKFEVPSFFLRGAGDTYFSGKMLAKLGRILLITDELRSLKKCSDSRNQRWRAGIECAPSDLGYTDADIQELHQAIEGMQGVELPSEDSFNKALSQLRQGVEVWINGTAEAPFLYDKMWGGLVNCGCSFSGEIMGCTNKYPNCPAFGDPGLNFGNAYYNDHHFHYGYHIYSAAVVAKFDPAWGRKHFENVVMYIRDIANPSPEDKYFPLFRQKDWYTGNSWASGIVKPPFLNGRNQESSSEAIAAYEGIALYGEVMSNNWDTSSDKENSLVAKHVRDIGRLLTATELRAAQRYWHVRPKGDQKRVYADVYAEEAVGIVWNLMVQFGTWFGADPFLVYGIQLLPLTPVSEDRDELAWVGRMYPALAESCEASDMCTKQGWSVLQFAALATLGHRAEAIRRAKELPPSAFTEAGGNGNSLSNTIWYFSTRPGGKDKGDDGTTSLKPDHGGNDGETPAAPFDPDAINCGCPEACTRSALLGDAQGFTCKSRMAWLMNHVGKSEEDACSQVAGDEFPDECGKCDPAVCKDLPATIAPCPPCPVDVCTNTTINQCNPHNAPYLCLEGGPRGGCARVPWSSDTTECSKCCEVIEECMDLH